MFNLKAFKFTKKNTFTKDQVDESLAKANVSIEACYHLQRNKIRYSCKFCKHERPYTNDKGVKDRLSECRKFIDIAMKHEIGDYIANFRMIQSNVPSSDQANEEQGPSSIPSTSKRPHSPPIPSDDLPVKQFSREDIHALIRPTKYEEVIAIQAKIGKQKVTNVTLDECKFIL